MTKVYFDVCCLNRPFDDQSQDRVRLETTAIAGILRRIEIGEWTSISSEAVQDEIEGDPDKERRARVQEVAALSEEVIEVNKVHLARAAELQKLGFHAFDALHIACAEIAKADVLLTTDDRMLRLALRLFEELTVKIANPVAWLLEVQNDQ